MSRKPIQACTEIGDLRQSPRAGSVMGRNLHFGSRAAFSAVILLASAAAHAAGAGSLAGNSRFAQAPPHGASRPGSAAPPKVVAPPDTESPSAGEGLRPGDRWVYELKDEISGEVRAKLTQLVTEVTNQDIVLRVTSSRQPNPWTVVLNRDWSVTDGVSWKFTPNDCQGITPELTPASERHCSYTAKSTKSDTLRRGDR